MKDWWRIRGHHFPNVVALVIIFLWTAPGKERFNRRRSCRREYDHKDEREPASSVA
jgi:hypothetical protein